MTQNASGWLPKFLLGAGAFQVENSTKAKMNIWMCALHCMCTKKTFCLTSNHDGASGPICHVPALYTPATGQLECAQQRTHVCSTYHRGYAETASSVSDYFCTVPATM